MDNAKAGRYESEVTGGDLIPRELSSLIDGQRPETVHQILLSAVRQFAAHGFEATTTRRIGQGAGVSSAGLYVYFSSKEELLYEISLIGHRGALLVIEEALAKAGDEPAGRLRSVVHAFVLFHAEHCTLARVVQYELRVLAPRHFAEVSTLRRDIDCAIRTCIEHGVAAGLFACADINSAALAIESLGIDTSRWFDPKSAPMSPSSLARVYSDFALQIVRARM